MDADLWDLADNTSRPRGNLYSECEFEYTSCIYEIKRNAIRNTIARCVMCTHVEVVATKMSMEITPESIRKAEEKTALELAELIQQTPNTVGTKVSLKRPAP